LEPQWDETLELPVKDRQDELFVKVMDHDTVARDDFLGSAKIPLGSLRKDEEKVVTVKLEGLYFYSLRFIGSRCSVGRNHAWIDNQERHQEAH
jgi:Ca2+-dependent lipid-binding protein